MLNYLIDRAEKMDMLNKRRSARQKEKIQQAIRANPDAFAASKTNRAIAADIETFGIERVFGRDEDSSDRRVT